MSTFIQSADWGITLFPALLFPRPSLFSFSIQSVLLHILHLAIAPAIPELGYQATTLTQFCTVARRKNASYTPYNYWLLKKFHSAITHHQLLEHLEADNSFDDKNPQEIYSEVCSNIVKVISLLKIRLAMRIKAMT